MGPTPAQIAEDPPQPLYPLPIHEYTQHLSALRAELLASAVPAHGLADTDAHLRAIAAAVPRAREPTYFGFVTGGVTPAAQHADELVSRLDASVSVHLPDVSIATTVEDTALRWLLEMLRFDPKVWALRTCTTGATASNVLGLACGREWIVREAARRGRRVPDVDLHEDVDGLSVARLGLAEAVRRVGVRGIRVLSAGSHSSLRKAASIVGFGHEAVVEVPTVQTPGHTGSTAWLDLENLERYLQQRNFLHIVVVSAGEINTGFFGSSAYTFREIRRMCNEYGAWLHVDAGMCVHEMAETGQAAATVFSFVCAIAV
jgi:glutamate/tyrosine decarboxylase-like PLP-dependent enzyme